MAGQSLQQDVDKVGALDTKSGGYSLVVVVAQHPIGINALGHGVHPLLNMFYVLSGLRGVVDAGTGEEAQSQPWVSKIIYIGLGYQSLTAKYKLRKSCIVTILALALLTCHTHLHVFGISDHNIGVVTYPITKVILAVLMPPAKKPVQNLWRAKLKHIITCSTIR